MSRAAAHLPEASTIRLPADLPLLSRLLIATGLKLAQWKRARRTRHALARLDDHLLRDIGVLDVRGARRGSRPSRAE